jgi:hypothetical protein
MEVHHHPDLHHEKKPWKEYLLEGLMIFLAVTMGFFAESLRENIGAKEKEKEYIASFENNLEKDKATLDYIIQDNKKKVKGLDTLLSLFDKDMSNPANRKKVYDDSWCVSDFSVFISNDATMTQLKNSGGLQFIKHAHIADSVSKYDQEVRGIYAAEAAYTKYTDYATEAMTDLLYFNLKKNADGSWGNAKELYPLLSQDPQRVQIFFNKIKLERGWTQNYINNLNEKQPFVNQLIALLKKEYD